MWTTEGVVPFLKHPIGFYMPVKLRIVPGKPGVKGLYPPMRSKSFGLVYALPGGGNYYPS